MCQEELNRQKAWAFLTASLRLCSEAYRIVEKDAIPQEVRTLQVAIDNLLTVKKVYGRRVLK